MQSRVFTKRFVPGSPVLASDQTDLMNMVRRIGESSVDETLEAVLDKYGIKLRAATIPELWAKITEVGAATDTRRAPHAWMEQYKLPGGRFEDKKNKDGVQVGLNGTLIRQTAYEVNGRTAPVGTIVQLKPGLDHEEYLFELAVAGDSFWAMLYGKKSFVIEDESSDPLFNSDFPPILPPRLRGSYSWIEMAQAEDGEFKPLSNGRFGVAGEMDGAEEINRSNANMHLEQMIVRMYIGDRWSIPAIKRYADTKLIHSSLERVSTSIDWRNESSFEFVSTDYKYWFNVCVPREDFANRYVLSNGAGNDLQ